jgi:excisionase family DNA binding protein
MELEKYITPKQLAASLSVGLSTVYQWYQHGLLRGTKIGRVLRFKKSDTLKFLESKEKAASRRAFKS